MAVEVVTDGNFDEKLAGNEKVVVKYYADWCGSCRLFTPKYKRLSADQRFVEVSFLEVNAELNPGARKAAGVTNLPFFAIFKNGRLIDGFSGSREEAVVELISKLN